MSLWFSVPFSMRVMLGKEAGGAGGRNLPYVCDVDPGLRRKRFRTVCETLPDVGVQQKSEQLRVVYEAL